VDSCHYSELVDMGNHLLCSLVTKCLAFSMSLFLCWTIANIVCLSVLDNITHARLIKDCDSFFVV
jgi:hypothetical protein